MGLSRSYVYALLADPPGALDRARKDRYRGSCEVCGKPTHGSNGRAKAPRRCSAHVDHDEIVRKRGDRRWGRQRIIDAIRKFANRYGRPPRAADWNPGMATSLGHNRRVERFHQDGCWPYAQTVKDAFGSWGNGIEAAGFPRPEQGQYDRAQVLS